jgi:hypothetical protein
MRGRTLVEREKEYVRGARALGASHLRTLFVYILPSVLPTATVIALIELAVLMLVESILSFIGPGIDPPAVSWARFPRRAPQRRDRMVDAGVSRRGHLPRRAGGEPVADGLADIPTRACGSAAGSDGA